MKEINTQELKHLQLNILDCVDEYCRKHDITYYLFAGTLIGAVRHYGYIPWDDDIDICMKREDYENFFSHFNEEDHHGMRAIYASNYNGYYLASGKVINEKTAMIEATNFNVPIGIYIDVFPMDRLPDDIKKIKGLNAKIAIYRNMLLLKSITLDSKRSIFKNLILAVCNTILKPISVSWLLSRISALSQTYSADDSCTKLADISVFTYGMREVFHKEDFDETVELTFENKKYPAPAGYDNILKSMYGDYMQLPPEDKRVSHHVFTAYWREVESL